MSAVNVPKEVAKELEDRKIALLATERHLQNLEEEIKQHQVMRENIISDIALIEHVVNAFTNRTSQKKDELSPASQTVLKALAEANGPVRGGELIKTTGLAKGTVAVTLRRLGERRLAVNDKKTHTWSIT
jgi:uncharacterized membrane protein